MPETTALPSAWRKRRELHRAFAATMAERKRQRKLRAEIHAAMARARETVAYGFSATVTVYHAKPYRAPDIKDPGAGWRIVDDAGNIVTHVASRDKARAQARELTDSGELHPLTTTQTHPPKSLDEAMLELGWERVETNGRRPTVEEKYRRVAA